MQNVTGARKLLDNMSFGSLTQAVTQTKSVQPIEMIDTISVGEMLPKPLISCKCITFSGIKGDELNTKFAYISHKAYVPMYSPKPKHYVSAQYADKGFPPFPPPGFGIESREVLEPSFHVSQLESLVEDRMKACICKPIDQRR